MAKIFVNYRRDDDPSAAARVRDGLAARFGKSALFMDVDNLLAGQKFDDELAKALSACDVLVSIIGVKWSGILSTRTTEAQADPDHRDYVREEIAAALKRGIVVIPVRVGRDGALPALPRPSELPEDIRALVAHQKHDVTHERFGRDVADLADAIIQVRKAQRGTGGGMSSSPVWIGATTAALLAVGYLGAGLSGVPVPGWPVNQGSTRAPEVPLVADYTIAAFKPIAHIKKLDTDFARLSATGSRAELEAFASTNPAFKPRVAEVLAARDAATEAETKRVAAAKAEAERKAADEAARRVPKPGDTFRDCPTCPEMVVVPAGSFKMGSPDNDERRDADEGPVRTVTIGQPFAVGKFEVTFAEWEACVAGGGCQSNKTPSDQGWGKGRRPVINVSWDDTKEYVGWLSKTTGKSYRLLTEAEWEYAARAGTTTRYAFGDTITTKQAQFSEGALGSAKQTIEVGSLNTPNAFGLHDMHGNVWEWVEDCWIDNYKGASTDASARTTACTDDRSRVLRGGSWDNDPENLRSAVRSRDSTFDRSYYYGFRVSRSVLR